MVVAMANNGLPHFAPPPPPLNAAMQALPPNYHENGRAYHGYRKGKYLFPCDEAEMDRMDLYHKFFQVARKEKLHSTPFTPNYDLRILDLGAGTGIWAIDMADKYPQAEVIGLDLSNIQPALIPPNLSFQVPRDIEAPWHLSLGSDSFDLVHVRMLNGSISDWPELYKKAFSHLKPGYGWIEHVELDMEPRCDDGTIPGHSVLVKWYRYLMDAMRRAERPMEYNHDTGALLQRQGFVDIREEVIRIPFNPWPKDRELKTIGSWFNLGLTDGLSALSMAPFTRMFNWSSQNVDDFVKDVRNEVCNRQIHAYCHLHVWIARRPSAA